MKDNNYKDNPLDIDQSISKILLLRKNIRNFNTEHNKSNDTINNDKYNVNNNTSNNTNTSSLVILPRDSIQSNNFDNILDKSHDQFYNINSINSHNLTSNHVTDETVYNCLYHNSSMHNDLKCNVIPLSFCEATEYAFTNFPNQRGTKVRACVVICNPYIDSICFNYIECLIDYSLKSIAHVKLLLNKQFEKNIIPNSYIKTSKRLTLSRLLGSPIDISLPECLIWDINKLRDSFK